MIELVSIDATNFRSFGQAQFAPLGAGQGLTAINGVNGSGKSSIATTALLWCLFGVTPDGVTVKSLRRQGSEGEVRVTVTFRHQGDTITVTRALRGKNDTTVAGITVNDIEQTSVSARTAKAWVEARLGVDEEAFTTAFVVRQKEVDALVRARPAERRALVERLAGIDRLADALKNAREEARAVYAQANAIRIDMDPAEAATAAETAETAAAAAQDTADRAAVDADTARVTATETADALAALNTALDAVRQADHDRQLADAAAKAAEKELARVRAAAEGADRLADAQAAAADAATELNTAKNAAQVADDAAARAAADEATAVEARQAAADAQSAFDAAQAAVEAAETALAGLTPVAEEQVEQARETAEDLRSRWSVLNAETDRLDQVLVALRGTVAAGHATCPTCAQGLDQPDALIVGLEADLRARETERDTVQRDGKAAADAHKNTQAAAAAYRDAVAKVNAAQRTRDAASGLLTRENQRLTRAEDAAETSAEAAFAAAAKARDALVALPALTDASQQADAALRKAETAAEAAETLPGAEADYQAAADTLTQALTALQAAQNGIEGVDADQVRQAASAAAEAAALAVAAASDLRAAATIAAQDAALARDTATKAAEAAQAKADALTAAEVAQATASALEEFRRDRLARLAPELSEVASDIVATMTEGRYTAVELDEDFTPTLTEAATGLERPTSWLSGGEESAVALALRLAIGDVVAGQQVGLLVLDEVLTAHDKARRAAVMSAVRALPHRQVITINHASEATDQVDLIAYVVPGDDGSTIEHSAGDAPAAAVTGLDLD